jgi:hypothetical protein
MLMIRLDFTKDLSATVLEPLHNPVVLDILEDDNEFDKENQDISPKMISIHNSISPRRVPLSEIPVHTLKEHNTNIINHSEYTSRKRLNFLNCPVSPSKKLSAIPSSYRNPYCSNDRTIMTISEDVYPNNSPSTPRMCLGFHPSRMSRVRKVLFCNKQEYVMVEKIREKLRPRPIISKNSAY